MSRNFTKSGLDVKEAENLGQALHLILKEESTWTPDFVITDDELSDGSGLDLARRSREDLDHPPYFIMLTSMGKKGDSQRVSEVGFAAYLAKPASHDVMLEMLSFILGAQENGDTSLVTKYTLSEARAASEKLQGPQNIALIEKPQGGSEGSTDIDVKVIIAEDDPMIQKVLTKMMKKLKQEFTLVENGQLAVDHYASEGADLILMDWHMPELDGLAATRKIREIEQGDRKTWIVALTAGGRDDAKAKCLEAGMDDHLMKPFEIPAFISMFEHAKNMAYQLRGDDV